MENSAFYSTWLEIDLDAIQNNLRLIQAQAGVAVMAVVKANGYGHGALPAARAAVQAAGAWGGPGPAGLWLGVARLEEALELRRAGLAEPILIMGHTPPARYDEAIAQQITLTVWHAGQVEALAAAAARVGQVARVHLKVDSGMSRLGVEVGAAVEFGGWLAGVPGVQFAGIFTHFARADEADPAPTDRQELSFNQALDGLAAAGCLPETIHAANSAAGLARPSARCTLVRAGIAMYGLQPGPARRLPDGFRAALSWKAVLSQVKQLPAGRGVSYGHEYITRSREWIGTVPVGYADGYRRLHGNRVIVGGRVVPVVGRICMDQLMVQLDTVPQAQPGDEVVLIGSQGQAAIPAEAVADVWGTINYEVVCAIGPRVPRLYV